MKNNELNIIFKEIPLSKPEEQKRMDEVCKILYELYCQNEKSKSIHVNFNNNLKKEKCA